MLLFQPPHITHRQNSPADMLATDKSLLLGYTVAKYMDQPVVRSNKENLGSLLTGSDEPRKFADAQLNETRERPEGNHLISVLDEGMHRFSWEIELPPAPQPVQLTISEAENWPSHAKWGWMSQPQPSQIIFDSLNSKRFNVEWGLRPVAPWHIIGRLPTARVFLEPLPNQLAFMNHIRAHEMQHVRDHVALAKCIFGPLDHWLQKAKNKRIKFTGKNLFDLRAHVTLAGGYATGLMRIVRYWISCCEQSGDLYHDTKEGAPPILKYKTTIHSDNHAIVWLTIETQKLLQDAFGPDAGAHQNFFNLRPLSHPIDGNEGKLRRDGGVLTDRVILTDDLDHKETEAIISLDEPQDLQLNFGSIFSNE